MYGSISRVLVIVELKPLNTDAPSAAAEMNYPTKNQTGLMGFAGETLGLRRTVMKGTHYRQGQEEGPWESVSTTGNLKDLAARPRRCTKLCSCPATFPLHLPNLVTTGRAVGPALHHHNSPPSMKMLQAWLRWDSGIRG